MEVKVELGDFTPEIVKMLEAVGGSSSSQVFPHLMAALNKAALLYQATWRRFASGTPIPGTSGKTIRSTGPYVRSIQTELSNPIQKIVYTDYPGHKYIEDGAPETDLKPGLLSGPKSRATAKGGRINVVAFRHDVPSESAKNPMPVNIYNLMLQETKRAESTRQSRLGVRATLPKGQGGEPQTKVTQFHGTYTWSAGKHEGMQRIDTSTGKAKSSKYITFRTVSSQSDPASWIVPEREPIPIRQAVVDTVTPIVRELLKDAFVSDIS